MTTRSDRERKRCRAVKRSRNNTYFQATIDLHPGDIIHSEPPLASLPVSLADFIDRGQYLDPNAPNNGAESLQRMRSDLEADKRVAFDKLFNKKQNGGIVSLVATNAFTDTETHGGYKRMVLRIYERISRANHSCRPNATVSWNPIDQVAFISALRSIRSGEEITILYFVSEDFSLKSQAQRIQELQQEYNFTCNCPDCSLAGQALTNNDNSRAQALQQFNAIKAAFPNFANIANEDQLRTAKLTVAQQLCHYTPTTPRER